MTSTNCSPILITGQDGKAQTTCLVYVVLQESRYICYSNSSRRWSHQFIVITYFRVVCAVYHRTGHGRMALFGIDLSPLMSIRIRNLNTVRENVHCVYVITSRSRVCKV